MAYATQAQMEIAAGGAARLVELSDWDSDGTADTTVIAQCLAEVDSIINSYAAAKYAVPVEDPSVAFQAIAAAEYVYWLTQKRRLVSPEDKEAHDERVAWLVKLSKGQVLPSDPTPTKSSAVKSAWVDRASDDVSRSSLEGFS
jgi:phage gp36-like protein